MKLAHVQQLASYRTRQFCPEKDCLAVLIGQQRSERGRFDLNSLTRITSFRTFAMPENLPLRFSSIQRSQELVANFLFDRAPESDGCEREVADHAGRVFFYDEIPFNL